MIPKNTCILFLLALQFSASFATAQDSFTYISVGLIEMDYGFDSSKHHMADYLMSMERPSGAGVEYYFSEQRYLEIVYPNGKANGFIMYDFNLTDTLLDIFIVTPQKKLWVEVREKYSLMDVLPEYVLKDVTEAELNDFLQSFNRGTFESLEIDSVGIEIKPGIIVNRYQKRDANDQRLEWHYGIPGKIRFHNFISELSGNQAFLSVGSYVREAIMTRKSGILEFKQNVVLPLDYRVDKNDFESVTIMEYIHLMRS